MTDNVQTEEGTIAAVRAGDRLLLWNAQYAVTQVERVDGLVKLHLDRHRIGFVEPNAWSPLLSPGTAVRRIVSP